MAQQMTGVTYAVEIGSWVESSTPKRDGSGMRKVWQAGDKGAESRLAVIAHVDGKADRHMVSLPVGDADERVIASHVLTLALQGVTAYGEHAAKPKAQPNPPTPPKSSAVIHAAECTCAECDAKRERIESAIKTARDAKSAPKAKVAKTNPPASKPAQTDENAKLASMIGLLG